MKTYKLGTFEVMTEDYVINPSYKGRCNVTWDDYEFGLYKSLRDLKEDGWRVPSREEALYLHKLHKEGLLGLQSSINEGKYFIQQKKFLSISLEKYTSYEVGMPTLKDLIDELSKPGRDPRKQFKQIESQILLIKNLLTLKSMA